MAGGSRPGRNARSRVERPGSFFVAIVEAAFSYQPLAFGKKRNCKLQISNFKQRMKTRIEHRWRLEPVGAGAARLRQGYGGWSEVERSNAKIPRPSTRQSGLGTRDDRGSDDGCAQDDGGGGDQGEEERGRRSARWRMASDFASARISPRMRDASRDWRWASAASPVAL